MAWTAARAAVQRVEAFREERGWTDRTVFLHVGAFADPQEHRAPWKPSSNCPGTAAGLGRRPGLWRGRDRGSHRPQPARQRILLLGYVDAATRALLYQSATALAFPSLDEGFGMPVLEAMAAGLPVLTGARSALPEVAGDAAVLVDPLHAEAIRDGLQRLSQDAELRKSLARQGHERVRAFSWDHTARLTWTAYEATA